MITSPYVMALSHPTLHAALVRNVWAHDRVILSRVPIGHGLPILTIYIVSICVELRNMPAVQELLQTTWSAVQVRAPRLPVSMALTAAVGRVGHLGVAVWIYCPENRAYDRRG